MSEEEADFVVFESQIIHFIDDSAKDLLAKLEEEELEAFKTSTQELMVRVENEKGIKGSKPMDHSGVVTTNLCSINGDDHQEQDSETADTSVNIIPLKRSFSPMVGEHEEKKRKDDGIEDACSATRKAAQKSATKPVNINNKNYDSYVLRLNNTPRSYLDLCLMFLANQNMLFQ
ncbi:hypothetical protein RND81_09G111800 [Saponaria officinalis]|uniref:Uncharacterized protein n=1 Tax=Saponaria officinalis TaxID=3572 RepID=A0AAW1IK94_SAPOF